MYNRKFAAGPFLSTVCVDLGHPVKDVTRTFGLQI